MNRIIAICILISLTSPSFVDADSLVHKIKPGSFRFQFAGNSGIISIGPSWNLYRKILFLETSVGFVPADNPLHRHVISGAKLVYSAPVTIRIKNLELKPVNAGYTATYTFGERYNRFNKSNKYPVNYYWWNTALRFGFIYQIKIKYPLGKGFFTAAETYFETGFWDLELSSYLANSNYKYLTPFDIVILGAGMNLYF